ncbi:MAG: hypothetical protein NVSMB65_20050 [Chloroflexota bacterium]
MNVMGATAEGTRCPGKLCNPKNWPGWRSSHTGAIAGTLPLCYHASDRRGGAADTLVRVVSAGYMRHGLHSAEQWLSE